MLRHCFLEKVAWLARRSWGEMVTTWKVSRLFIGLYSSLARHLLADGRSVSPTATCSERRHVDTRLDPSTHLQGRDRNLRHQGHVVGRSPDADITIDDPYSSEFHARVGLQDDKVVVHDLGSTNGTYVNGRRVTSPT